MSNAAVDPRMLAEFSDETKRDVMGAIEFQQEGLKALERVAEESNSPAIKELAEELKTKVYMVYEEVMNNVLLSMEKIHKEAEQYAMINGIQI